MCPEHSVISFSTVVCVHSFLKGGPKHLKALSFHIENQLKAPTVSPQKGTKQRKCIYWDLKQRCEAAGIDSSLVESAQFLFHRLRKNAACLHFPLNAGCDLCTAVWTYSSGAFFLCYAKNESHTCITIFIQFIWQFSFWGLCMCTFPWTESDINMLDLECFQCNQ